MTAPARARRPALLAATVSSAALAAALALGELVARATGAGRDVRDHGVASRLESAAPCLRVEGFGGGRRLARNPTADGAPPGDPVPLARRPGVARIALVGESSAALLGDALRDRLGSSPCRGRCEVLSCGGQGAPVESVALRFEEVLAYRPDVVVLIFGHNFRYSGPTPSPRARALAGFFAHGWARALLRSHLVAGLLVAEVERGAGGDGREHGRLAYTEAEVARMADRARARGVRLLAATVASNLLMPPALAAGEPADPALIEARYVEASEGREAALARLARAPETAPRAFQRGAWLLGLGRAGEAREQLRRALALDEITPRAPEEFNDFLRGLAARGRLALWDNARAVQDRAPLGVPGWDAFRDCCHLAGEAREAALRDLLARALAAAGAPPCAPPAAPPADPREGYAFLRAHPPGEGGTTRDWSLGVGLALARRFALDGDRADAAARDFLARGGGPDAAALGEALAGVAWAYREAGRAAQAWEVNARAAEFPGNAAAWLQRALWLVADRRPGEARAAAARAAAIDGARPDVRYVVDRLAAP